MLELIIRESDGLKNFFCGHGRVLFRNWLSVVGKPGEQWTIIQRANDKYWNFINTDGELISKEWFEKAEDFNGDLAIVKISGKGWNFIDKCGKRFCRHFYEMLSDLNYGNFVVVMKGGMYNFINKTTGQCVLSNWILRYEVDNGFVTKIQREDGLWNLVDKNMNILLKRFYAYIGPFVNGFAIVRRKHSSDELNYVNQEGKLLSQVWLSSVDNFLEDLEVTRVQRGSDSYYNLIKRDGKLLTRKWFKYISYVTYSDWIRVRREDGRCNYINAKGEMLSKKWWFFDATDFNENGFAVITNESNLKNVINTDGEAVLFDWYKDVELCYDSSAIVKADDSSTFKHIIF